MEEFLLQVATGVRLPAITRNEHNFPRMLFVASIPDFTTSDQFNSCSSFAAYTATTTSLVASNSTV